MSEPSPDEDARTPPDPADDAATVAIPLGPIDQPAPVTTGAEDAPTVAIPLADNTETAAESPTADQRPDGEDAPTAAIPMPAVGNATAPADATGQRDGGDATGDEPSAEDPTRDPAPSDDAQAPLPAPTDGDGPESTETARETTNDAPASTPEPDGLAAPVPTESAETPEPETDASERPAPVENPNVALTLPAMDPEPASADLPTVAVPLPPHVEVDEASGTSGDDASQEEPVRLAGTERPWWMPADIAAPPGTTPLADADAHLAEAPAEEPAGDDAPAGDTAGDDAPPTDGGDRPWWMPAAFNYTPGDQGADAAPGQTPPATAVPSDDAERTAEPTAEPADDAPRIFRDSPVTAPLTTDDGPSPWASDADDRWAPPPSSGSLYEVASTGEIAIVASPTAEPVPPQRDHATEGLPPEADDGERSPADADADAFFGRYQTEPSAAAPAGDEAPTAALPAEEPEAPAEEADADEDPADAFFRQFNDDSDGGEQR